MASLFVEEGLPMLISKITEVGTVPDVNVTVEYVFPKSYGVSRVKLVRETFPETSPGPVVAALLPMLNVLAPIARLPFSVNVPSTPKLPLPVVPSIVRFLNVSDPVLFITVDEFMVTVPID